MLFQPVISAAMGGIPSHKESGSKAIIEGMNDFRKCGVLKEEKNEKTEEAKRPLSQYEKMTKTPVSRLILTLAAPTIVSMMVTNIYNTADTWFVSREGTSASGAVSIVFSLMAIYQAFGFMFGHGAGSNISRKLGEKHEEAVKTYASTSLFLSLAAGAVISVCGLLFMDPLLRLLGSTETILPYAREYVLWILLAGPLLSASCVLNNILRYEGRAFYAMIGLMTGGILNMIGDPVLMFGLGLGVTGAGISTAVSQLISFGILLSMFRGERTISRFRLRYFAKDFHVVTDILSAGFPSLIRQGLNSFTTILLNHQAAVYGDAVIAAMGIVSKVTFFISAVAIGIGQGLQPVAAFNYGARKYRRVVQAFRFTAFAGTLLLGAMAIVCIAVPAPIVAWFRDDAAVVAVGAAALRYQAVSCLFLSYSIAAGMLFQSIGVSGRATFLAALRAGICFIPLILLLPRMLGVTGIELAQPVSDILSTIISVVVTENFVRKLQKRPEQENVVSKAV